MPELPTGLAALPVAPHQLFRLRARLCPPLRPRFRRINRRRLRARTRILPRQRPRRLNGYAFGAPTGPFAYDVRGGACAARNSSFSACCGDDG